MSTEDRVTLEQKPAIPTIGPSSPYAWPTIGTDSVGSSFADRCPCNPKNGGSGICGCILGGPQVTC